MDIKSIDLNLILVFDALIRLRSVTRAADAVGLSQPATSGALARLRLQFGDQLFVRTGQEMKPTPLALELADPVRTVVETVNAKILRLSTFDPATSERSFTIVTPDIGEMTFIPRIAEQCALRAPGIGLRSRSIPRENAAAALESGQVDLALGFFPDLRRTGFFQQGLFKTRYVVHRLPLQSLVAESTGREEISGRQAWWFARKDATTSSSISCKSAA